VGRVDAAEGIRVYSTHFGRPVYLVEDPLPLIGHIAFGVIDRGTNVLQVRPTTLCPFSCIYCSVDAGPRSSWRIAEYVVKPEWLVRWVGKLAEFKGGGVEALIDGVGEPTSYPWIIELVKMLSKTPGVDRVAMETRGGTLSRSMLVRLSEAGLNRINVSVDSLDEDLARSITGTSWLRVSRVLDLIEWALENTGIDFILTPVVIPGVNEDQVEELVRWAVDRKLGAKSGWPTGVLIQKYEIYRHGRRVKGVRPWSWTRFYKWLKGLEERTGQKLRPSMEDIGMRKAPPIPKPYRRGDRLLVSLLAYGWLRGEMLGVDRQAARLITLVDIHGLKPGSTVRARVIRDKDNIFLARV